MFFFLNFPPATPQPNATRYPTHPEYLYLYSTSTSYLVGLTNDQSLLPDCHLGVSVGTETLFQFFSRFPFPLLLPLSLTSGRVAAYDARSRVSSARVKGWSDAGVELPGRPSVVASDRLAPALQSFTKPFTLSFIR